jgi:putative endonuclease
MNNSGLFCFISIPINSLMNNDIYTVYVIFSFKNNIFYTGYTSNLVKRFNDHNYNNISGFTVKYRPWVVLYSEIFYTKSDALSREKYLKSGVGREFIRTSVFPIYSLLW